LRGVGQRRNLDGFFQALLDAPGGEGLDGLGDFLGIVGRSRFGRICSAARRSAALALVSMVLKASGDFQQQAGSPD
jgi:hypothetical protein